jgi:hypothetical protein
MTTALAIRFTLLITLMASDADYAEVMAALLGDLALVPWQRPYQLPTATVASTWREAADAQPLEELRDKAARRAQGPRLPGRQSRGPGRGLDRRVADTDSGHPGEPSGVRVGRHRRRQSPLSAAAGAALRRCLHPRRPRRNLRPVRRRQDDVAAAAMEVLNSGWDDYPGVAVLI